MTRLDLIKQMILTPDGIKHLGKGWALFLFTALNSGKNNMLKTSGEQMVKAMGVPKSTIIKWRDCLEENKVIEVVSGKGSMILKLLPPWDSIVTCELDDTAQIRRIGDPSTRRMLDDMSSLDMLSVVSSLGKMADKVQRLEQAIVSKA
jgi:hypothetical protein